MPPLANVATSKLMIMPQMFPGQSQIRKQLRLVSRKDVFYALQFQNYSILNNQSRR